MQKFKLQSFPLEQVRDLDGLEQRIAAWFVSRDFPCRLLAYSQPFSMRPAIARIRQSQAVSDALQLAVRPLIEAIDHLLDGHAATPAAELRRLPPAIVALLFDLCAQAPELQQLLADPEHVAGDDPRMRWAMLADAIDQALWRLPWTKEAIAFYETLEQRHLRSATYILLTWEPPDVSAQSLATTLRHAIGRPVERLDVLPSIISCAYREHATRLEPLEPGQPWLALLHSYDMQDEWDASTLHPLLSVNYDVALAVDINTLGRTRAQRRAEMAFNAANLIAGDRQLLDTRAERVTHDAQYALHEMRHQTLHELQIGVLVGGHSPEELETNVADIRDRLGPKLRLMRAAGAQGEVLKLFSQTPRKRLEAPWKPRTQLSHAVGCMLGVVGLHRASGTDGIFIGVDAVRRAPIFMDLFKNNQAAHIVVLGKTGFGKTAFINLLAERAATVGDMQVIGIDPTDNGPRVERALAGAKSYPVGLEHTVNILDVVFNSDSEGGWLHNQVLYVEAQLSLLYGSPGKTSTDKDTLLPRVFTSRERGVWQRLIEQLYVENDIAPDTPGHRTPILSDLLALLEADGDPVAAALGLDLRYLLYGTERRDAVKMTAEGIAFNGHTTIDWHFRRPVTYFDFHDVPPTLIVFYYLHAIGHLNRYLQLPGRDRRRKIFVEIDEFGYASQVEAVAQLAADLCKTARKYGCGVVLVDQNPLTFLETRNGRTIFELAAARIFFHLEDIAAEQVGRAMSVLTPEHVAFLPHAQIGECLAVIKNDVYRVNVEMNQREARSFMGS